MFRREGLVQIAFILESVSPFYLAAVGAKCCCCPGVFTVHVLPMKYIPESRALMCFYFNLNLYMDCCSMAL